MKDILKDLLKVIGSVLKVGIGGLWIFLGIREYKDWLERE